MMADFQYGISSFERDRSGNPELPVINMFAEAVPNEEKPVLLSRPGLMTSSTIGSGPIKGLFRVDGVLNTAMFAVSGADLYKDDDLVDSIVSTPGSVSFAGYEDLVFVNAGAEIWGYDDVTLTAVAFPGDADVIRICVGASRLLAIKSGTGTFYWSDPLTDTIDTLSFATAEQSPDKLRDMMFLGDRLILLGAETVEFWQINDDADLPFVPALGLTYPVGIKNTGAAAKFNGSFAWVTDKNKLCLGEPDNVLSFPGLQKKIEEESEVFLWTFEFDGDEYLVVRLPDESWAIKANANTWTKLESYGEDNWLPQCYEEGYFGSASDGSLYTWSDTYDDFDSVLERRFRAYLPINSGGIPFHSIILRTCPGLTPYLTGDYIEPVIQMRLSKDNGRTWGNWKSRSLGQQGEYRRQTRWNSMGIQGYPGALVEFRVTDPVDFGVADLVLNENYGGG